MAPRMRRRITSAKREEIEKQQKALSQAIVRPFEVLSGLPLSYNPPPNGHYEDVLKNPLTTKDAGVLYRSLMKSRLNYMNIGPMFKLYWLKQSSYAKKMQQLDQEKNTYKTQKEEKPSERVPILGNDVSARDVMVKLCDASLSLGPHKFEIRLFIAKDERSEKNGKKKEDEDKSKKDNSISEKIISGKELNINDKISNPMSPVNKIKESTEANESKCSEEQNKIHVNEQPAKVESTIGKLSNESKENATEKSELSQSSASETHNISKSTNELDSEQIHNKSDSNLKGNIQTKTYSIQGNKLENLSTKGNGNGSDERSISKGNSVQIDKNETPKVNDYSQPSNNESESKNQNASNPSYDLGDSKPSNSQASTLEQQPSVESSSTIQQPSVSATQNSSPSPPVVSKNDPNSMQSIENTIMIANLNTIARVDQSLNALMKIVALGNASPQQIITFQGYIQRAREMGPQAHHAYLFPNGILPNQRPRKIPKDKKPPKEKKQPKPKVPKDQKLTAFQEKYLTDATILFEFVENANVRYILPQEAVCEVLPPATYNAEEPDNKDILVSFLWIHNQHEVDNYNQKLNDYNDYKKKEEEELNKDKSKEVEEVKNTEQGEAGKLNEGQMDDKQQKDNEKQSVQTLENEQNTESEQKPSNKDEVTNVKQEDENNEEEPVTTKSGRKPPSRKARRRRGGPVPKKKVISKKIECPIEPEIKYTALSLTIHGIPSRYVPIIVNSFKKLEDVQDRMSYILKNGMRIASFYLWYQVDGKLDEAIAEDIRVQLNHEEKKIQGVTSTQSSTSSTTAVKKRKQKEKGSDSKPKKAKAELIDSALAPVAATAPTPTHSENQNLETNVKSESIHAPNQPSTDDLKSETSLAT